MKILKWLKRTFIAIIGLTILCALTGVAYEQISRLMVNQKFPPPGQLIDVGGHKLHMQSKWTGGPTVVFESGLDNGWSLTWEKVQDEIAKVTNTVSYDRAGIMWSERGNSPKTSEAIASELHALLMNSGHNGPYILVGHSLAGYTLRAFVRKYPQEVAWVVFVDASHPDQFNRFPPGSLPSLPPEWLVKSLDNLWAVRLFFSDNVYKNTSKDDYINTVNNSYLPISVYASMEEGRNIEKLAKEASTMNSFGDIPLIVITATNPDAASELWEKIRKISMGLQTELLWLSTHSEQIFADNSGHFIQLERPDLVISSIKKILDELKQQKILSK